MLDLALKILFFIINRFYQYIGTIVRNLTDVPLNSMPSAYAQLALGQNRACVNYLLINSIDTPVFSSHVPLK